MKRTGIGLSILFLLVFSGAFSQKTIDAVVSKTTVNAYERFNYEIITNSNCKITPPSFGGLEIVGGPQQSSMNSTQIINGVRTQTVEYRITYQLRAKKEGNYTISTASMDCGGETYETESKIKITVSKGQNNASGEQDFFLKLSSNKSSVYEGEPFIATLKYYSKIRPESIETLDLGDASGIWRQDLNPDRQTYETNVENVNGMRYYTIVLREELCFAQRSGKVTLEPYYSSLVFSQGFFNRFRKESYSNSLDITVKDIPNNSQSDFNGLVGDFSITSELSKSDVKIGEAIDLKIIIEGKGNMQALGNVELNFPDEFDQFDPEIVDRTKVSRSGVNGKIEYNFVLIPKHHGNYEVPGYSFSYFDLASMRMEHLSTDDFNITVEKRDGESIEPSKNLVEATETDIRYISESSPDLFTSEDFLFGTWTYYTGMLSPLCLSFLFIYFRRKKENLTDDDKVKIQQKKAIKVAASALKDVRVLIEKGEEKEALKQLQSTLFGFFMKKFNVGLSDISQRAIDTRLQEANIDETLRTDFNTIWNAIEMGQYAPIAQENLIQTVDKTENLITELDKKI